jgi:pyruvate,orthophosphate dikinase
VGAKKELDDQAEIVRRVADEVFSSRGRKVKYAVGTMIEIPRGAITAAEIAKTAEFFSFGTNDLTQTTFGLSRDDTGPVLAAYLEKDIWPVDPFVSIDRDGVGALMKLGVAGGRASRPDMKLGICGEHGGDPSSVEFCHQIGLDYVSCSPYRLPIARLAAAQAALKEKPAAAGKAARAPKGAAQAAPRNGKRARPGRNGRIAAAAAAGIGAALAGKSIARATKRAVKAVARRGR